MISQAKQKKNYTKRGLLIGLLLFVGATFGSFLVPQTASASLSPQAQAKYQCGSKSNTVKMSINIGCEGNNCKTSNVDGCSALLDGTFAIIRFLSAGVGIIIIGSIIFAGIQYASARDDPGATSKAKQRIMTSASALLLFIFAYAILNYVIPAGFFR